jgi:hypothetical protein
VARPNLLSQKRTSMAVEPQSRPYLGLDLGKLFPRKKRDSEVGHGVALVPSMLTILFILLLVALIGGGVGHSRFGYAGWSPAGLLIVVLLVLFLTGNRL